MAQTRGQLAAQKKVRASMRRERGNQCPSTRDGQGQIVPEHVKSPHSSLPGIVLHQKDPTSRRGQKRSSVTADPLERVFNEPPQKRRRQSFHPIQENLGHEAIQDDTSSQTNPINFWVQENKWPSYLKQSRMEHVLARKKSSPTLSRKRSEAGSGVSTTPSDQRPREEKCTPYRDPRYKTLLATKGSFIDESNLGITNKSKTLCRTLLERKQVVPLNSLFRDDIFKSTCQKVEDKNETRVIRDITPLIVPSAENLATYGASNLDCLIESTNEGWNNSIPLTGTRPQPDYSVGFKHKAFTEGQLGKLSPFIGNYISGDLSFFMATYLMCFPFLTCEVKCGTAALDIADRQNAHSMTISARAIVELFRLVKREKELHRELLAFSISHDYRSVRIYGEYPIIAGNNTTYYRHPIHTFDFTTLDGKEKWTAYRFTKNVYDAWMPKHFKRICSAIDQLPSNVDFDVPLLPRGLASHHLSQPDDDMASASEDYDQQPSITDRVTRNTSFLGAKRPRKEIDAIEVMCCLGAKSVVESHSFENRLQFLMSLVSYLNLSRTIETGCLPQTCCLGHSASGHDRGGLVQFYVIIDFDACKRERAKLGLKAETFGWAIDGTESAREENDFYGLSRYKTF